MLPRDQPPMPDDEIRVFLFDNDGSRRPRCLDRGQLYRNFASGGRYFMYGIVPKLGMLSALSSCPSLQEVTGRYLVHESTTTIHHIIQRITRTAMLR